MGGLDVPKLWTVTTEERCMKNYYASFENLFSFKYPACSHAMGKRIEQTCTIVEMKGFSATMMSAPVRALLQSTAKVTSDNFPENMGVAYVVNTPFSFRAVWQVLKTFADERTVAKVHILSTDYQKKLFENCDPANLPEFLGGTCTCADRGGCQNSDAGPWNDYVPVLPFGAKLKSEVEKEAALK